MKLVKRTHIGWYAAAVMLALATMLGVTYVARGPAAAAAASVFAVGFLLGMLAMYIAVHVYRD
jgi:hypothetical protein